MQQPDIRLIWTEVTFDPRVLHHGHRPAGLMPATVTAFLRDDRPGTGGRVWVGWCHRGTDLHYPLRPAWARTLADHMRTQAAYAAEVTADRTGRPPRPFLRVPSDAGDFRSNLHVDATWPIAGEALVLLGTGPTLVLRPDKALALADMVDAVVAATDTSPTAAATGLRA